MTTLTQPKPRPLNCGDPACAGPYGHNAVSPGKGSGTMSEPKTCTLQAPGAVLCHDVREGGGAGQPVLNQAPGVHLRVTCARAWLTRTACAAVHPPRGR